MRRARQTVDPTTVDDAVIIGSLVRSGAVRPSVVHPHESRAIRLAVIATAPVWCAAIVVVAAGRLARRRLPLIVMHERVGYRRKAILVPKVATAAVDSNERCFAGLVEIARGQPVDLVVDEAFEKWLRVTGVDELPQLVLVALGTMRIVGPRPVTERELAEMGEGEVGVDVLHPGIVGLWQVLDRHGYLLPQRRTLDMAMVENWSPRLRRQIMALSLRQAFGRLATGSKPTR